MNEYATTEVLTHTLNCVLADLIGAYQAHLMGNSHIHDWEGHMLSIQDLSNVLDTPVPEELT